VQAIERRENRIYEWNFVRSLKRRMRTKTRAFPHLYRLDRLAGVKTVREFDERFTAPHHGFRDASDYYHRASALRVIDRIRVPTLLLTAENDPFVPVGPFRDPAIAANPSISVVVTRFGGHCGFVAAVRTPGSPPRGLCAVGWNGDDGYWAERMIVRFARTHSTLTVPQA
jgi:predicted alpha/beta-fold hydrolase